MDFVETYSHRDGAKMFSGTYLTDDSVYGSMERAIRTLTDAGFPDDHLEAV